MDPTAADDLSLLLESQRAEFAAASAAESDLDLAFRLQLQEAMAASLAAAPSAAAAAAAAPAPPNPPPTPGTALSDLSEVIALQGLELERYSRERADDELRAAELRRASEELRRRAYDERFAREIAAMSDDEWDDYGDHFERPFDARASGQVEEEPFLLYFKGMASTHHVRGKLMQFGAVGVAVCEPGGNLVLKVQKPVAIGAAGTSREVLDAKALIEGLNAVVLLGIKSVNVFFDFRVLYNHVIGKWGIKQRKIANMIDQVMLLRRKLERCGMFLLPRCHAQFVFKLARDVIESQMTKDVDCGSNSNLTETCDICLEGTDSSQMFSVDGCLHRFCFSCMKQHVEVKLLIGVLPGCPHEGCKVMLNLESSKKFLSPRLYEIMIHRINEASIPAAEKIYCPYPKCSALMSKGEAIRPEGFSSFQHYFVDTGLRSCIKCNGSFCINCKVPWHDKMSCYEYRRYLEPRAEDTRVKSLANQNSWRQCVKCNHMIELAEGCFHITCRCGYEFCYTCGAEWKNRKATCSCPLWDEDNILHDDADEDYNEDEDEYYDSDGDYYDDEDFV